MLIELVEMRKKKGLTREEAKKLLTGEDNLYFGAMMVRRGMPAAWLPAPTIPPAMCCGRLFRSSAPRRG